MKRSRGFAGEFFSRQEGVTSIEYALVALGMSLALAIVVPKAASYLEVTFASIMNMGKGGAYVIESKASHGKKAPLAAVKQRAAAQQVPLAARLLRADRPKGNFDPR